MFSYANLMSSRYVCHDEWLTAIPSYNATMQLCILMNHNTPPQPFILSVPSQLLYLGICFCLYTLFGNLLNVEGNWYYLAILTRILNFVGPYVIINVATMDQVGYSAHCRYCMVRTSDLVLADDLLFMLLSSYHENLSLMYQEQ